MRLVFFGTAEFAVPVLRAVAPHVSLVVSQPDRPSGRGMELRSSPVKQVARELGLSVVTPEKCRAPEFVEQLREEMADALVVVAYGQILSQAVLDSAKHGGINLHGSMLPFYRGAAPIQRSILAGDLETGVTLMQMDKGMDSGDVIAIVRTPLGPDETYGELARRLADLAAEMALAWMPRIVAGDYPRTPQDHESATLAPKVTKEEAELRWDRPAATEYNRFRAFHPSPGPYLSTAFGPIKLSAVRRGEREGSPGEVLAVQPELQVAFQTGSLRLLEIQPAGKKRMSGSAWANGLRLRPGTSLVPEALD